MISIILYGRNDAHGYNLHRRAALSLNCLAEVLTDDDDEIVFVDYNTPDELPTFVEALADTLTDRCLSRLRVLRVPAALHRERFESLTHLVAIEPVCRNAAVRRANPANRWLLSTNTDMILIPVGYAGLSDICRELPDGFYGVPRFELPEWLWERLPRTDPAGVLREVALLGPRLRLDETTLNDELVRYDAPGDFQLFLRDDFIAIDGFNEEMLLGWHVDSNFVRRMVLHRGSEESLHESVAGYHCNHTRTPTIFGSGNFGNDLTRFYFSVDRAGLPTQRNSWGLADVQLEEVSVRPGIRSRFTDAVVATVPDSPISRIISDVRGHWRTPTYDSGHVLPFVADSIAVSPSGTVVGYLGANAALESMLSHLVAELDEESTYSLVTASDASGLDRLDDADLLVVDFGLDSALSSNPADDEGYHVFPSVPTGLRSVVIAFELLVQVERARLETGAHPRRFVLVNSTAAYVDALVISNLDCSHTSVHSRVRRATVKLVPSSTISVLRDLRWADRLEGRRLPIELGMGQRAEFAGLEDFRGFGPGWLIPDPSGIWTSGRRAVLALSCVGTARPIPSLLEVTFDRVGVRRGHPVRIGLVIDETRVETRVLTGGTRLTTWRARLPEHAVARRRFDVVLEIEGDGVWADRNRLGLHLRSLGLARSPLPIALRNWVDEANEAVRRCVRRSFRWTRRIAELGRWRSQRGGGLGP